MRATRASSSRARAPPGADRRELARGGLALARGGGARAFERARSGREARRRDRSRGRFVVARASKRAAKDPEAFGNDYDAIRAALMAERDPRSGAPTIGATLNWLSELAFGWRRATSRLSGPLDAAANAYGDFIDALPYRRQDGTLPSGRKWTIEDGVRRWRRSRARRAEDERVVEAFWRERGETRKGFAAAAMEHTMALAMDFDRGVISCETEEDSRALRSMMAEPSLMSVCERLESVRGLCLCANAADAARLAYSYPEILLTSNGAIVARLSALRAMIPGADVGRILRADAKSFLQRDVPEIKVRFRALRDAFPRVNVARLVEYDPSLLLLDVEVGLTALRELWTEEEFAQSDEDNPFFAEELSLAIKTLAGLGPEQFGGR